MKNHQLVVDIEDFRAIKKAEIILDGITVVAGENGCGKSTLSKLLYYLFKTANEYEFNLVGVVKNELESITFILDYILKNTAEKFPFQIEHNSTLEDYYSNISKRIQALKRDFADRKNRGLSDTILLQRIAHTLNNNFKVEIDPFDAKLSIEYLLLQVEKLVVQKFEDFYAIRDKRPTLLFERIFENSFGVGSTLKYLELKEFGIQIFSTEKEDIEYISTVRQAVYVDTPMMVGLERSKKNEHWNDLNEMLSEVRGQSANGSLALIQHQILSGEVVVENSITERFLYKRNDGKEFDLLSCATGVKSFAILQLLYKNGHLNDKTLLIIDEPEVHLHPQWIVEYARLMVLLNKELGVKFFIASHNPDMVSAIKYISEKEQTDGNLNYYLAEKEENEFTYTYRHLGTEIDDIFGSFNIAFDRINLYGTLE